MTDLRKAVVILENEDGIGRIDRWRDDGVVVFQYFISIPQISYTVAGQGARKQNRMLGRAFRLGRFVIKHREIVASPHQIDRRNHLATRFLGTHAEIVGNLEVLLPDFMVMRDGRLGSHRGRVRRLQIGGHILVHRLEFHIDQGRLVTEKHVFLTKQFQQIRWQIVSYERNILRVVHQNRLVAFLQARCLCQREGSHPNESFF